MIAPIVVVAAIVVLLYGALVRPRALDWGSTPEEQRADLPGGDLVPGPVTVTTRAITIAAPASVVWQWIVQMGQDRAGFYTHNWVERLLRSGIHDVHAIHPEWQELRPGDLMRTNHDIKGKPVGWPVAAVDPGRSLLLRSSNWPVGSYAFVLRPIDDRTTRLIVRDRSAWKRSELPFRALIYEPLHAYMETGLLQGAKQRAEGQAASPS
jgi:hypothetical protein